MPLCHQNPPYGYVSLDTSLALNSIPHIDNLCSAHHVDCFTGGLKEVLVPSYIFCTHYFCVFLLTFNPRCFPRALFRGNARLDASKSCVRSVLPWDTKQMNSSQVILKIMPLLYRTKMTSWKIDYLDTKICRVLHTKKTTQYPGCLLAFLCIISLGLCAIDTMYLIVKGGIQDIVFLIMHSFSNSISCLIISMFSMSCNTKLYQ